MKNTDLKQTYDKMHTKGANAWYSDGAEERINIFDIGKPWKNLSVLEIGCGEGELLHMICNDGGQVTGIDYSEVAIKSARATYPHIDRLHCYGWREYAAMTGQKYDVLVMEGVLEHLDQPFAELSEMIAEFKPITVITSMPCFINPRGIVWMTLDMLGAVMSKTDLHHIHPWQVQAFCQGNGYLLSQQTVEMDWGCGQRMIDDLAQRIPLALKDGKIKYKRRWLQKLLNFLQHAAQELPRSYGAAMVYRIDL